MQKGRKMGNAMRSFLALGAISVLWLGGLKGAVGAEMPSSQVQESKRPYSELISGLLKKDLKERVHEYSVIARGLEPSGKYLRGDKRALDSFVSELIRQRDFPGLEELEREMTELSAKRTIWDCVSWFGGEQGPKLLRTWAVAYPMQPELLRYHPRANILLVGRISDRSDPSATEARYQEAVAVVGDTETVQDLKEGFDAGALIQASAKEVRTLESVMREHVARMQTEKEQEKENALRMVSKLRQLVSDDTLTSGSLRELRELNRTVTECIIALENRKKEGKMTDREQEKSRVSEKPRDATATETELCNTPRFVLFPTLKRYLNSAGEPDALFVGATRSGSEVPTFASTPTGWSNWNGDGKDETRNRVLQRDLDGFRILVKLYAVPSPTERISRSVTRGNGYRTVLLLDQLFEGEAQATRLATVEEIRGDTHFRECRFYEDHGSLVAGKCICVELTIYERREENRTLAHFQEFLRKHYPKYVRVCKRVSDILRKKE